MSEHNSSTKPNEYDNESINEDDSEDIFDNMNPINDSEEDRPTIIVGVCAQWAKIKAKPMEEILSRLKQFDYFDIVIFDETTIHEKPIEEWPFCHALISFHSKGFPLVKAQEYARLRNPVLINDLDKQWDIMDRVRVHEILEEAGIAQPRYAVLRRTMNSDGTWQTLSVVHEQEDQIEIDGQIFHKPFVEKPVSAENHDVYIYFPPSVGGGSQRLFRKIGNHSSTYEQGVNNIRTDGSYIYEEFMPTDGTDVKVYTVGIEYAHAEARKSPGLDGKVDRDEFGKEVRYPVILRAEEKLIARKICQAFKQTVCGFDLLRAEGKSFVCDVNGFSFVKNSTKYYDDCALILRHTIVSGVPLARSIPYSLADPPDGPPIVPTALGAEMELRCLVAVIRHGDRTPKQKMKMAVLHPLFFQLFEKYNGPKQGHLKLKHPGQLQEVLEIARTLLKELDDNNLTQFPNSPETRSKLMQLKHVLELYGHFSGINRKIQLKYLPKGPPKPSSSEAELSDVPSQPSLLLIVKWGGQLTKTGRDQAEALGKAFRKMYPGGQGAGDDRSDIGLLRLHSTFRHDLKIYASDEGRVQMTAAAFAKGLLALEGELAPILVQMVKSANTNGLLDNDVDSTKEQQKVKQALHDQLAKDRTFTKEDYDIIAPTRARSLTTSMDYIENPVTMCRKIKDYIHGMNTTILERMPKEGSETLYDYEKWDLCSRRWLKLGKDFYNSHKEKFNISKVPDIYDSIKYDLLHNKDMIQYPQAKDLYLCSKALADIVVPQEYGITIEEKLNIARGIVTPLLRKIRADLESNLTGNLTHNEHVNKLDPRYLNQCDSDPISYSKGIQTPGRHVRTRLYFTSESHVHSLLTAIRYGGLLNPAADEQWKRSMEYLDTVSELNYLTQIVIMLYEDSSEKEDSEKRFHVELHFSPGAYGCFDVQSENDSDWSFPNPARTSLPKSNREAAHSPPRYGSIIPIKSPLEDIDETTMSSSLPSTEHIDIKRNSVDRTQAKIVKQRSFSSRTIYRNSTGLVTKETNLIKQPTNPFLKPKSLEDDESDLQHLAPFALTSAQIRRKSAAVSRHSLANLNRQMTLSEQFRRNSESTLSHNYYNTIHGASPDKYNPNHVSKIFSTRVISGAKTPPVLTGPRQTELVCAETVDVQPLETLNTNLNYKILDDFIGRITDSTMKSAPITTTTTPPHVVNNRFSVESVGNLTISDSTEKNKLTQYPINTISELPDDER